LPSDRDAGYCYGRANGKAENMHDIMAHVFMYDWMDNAQRQQRAITSRRFHTKTSQLRSQMVHRSIQQRNAPDTSQQQQWHMRRFKSVKPRTSTRFENEADILIPRHPTKN